MQRANYRGTTSVHSLLVLALFVMVAGVSGGIEKINKVMITACGSAYYNCSASQLGDVFRRHAASPHSARRLSLPA